MAHYRAYAVRFDGNFDGYESLSCTDDDEAIGKARRLADNSAIELWSGERSSPEWNASRSKAELTLYLLTLVTNALSPPSLGSYR